ncbi:gamma-glutamylcyclotransferase [Agromyces sp. SYSU T0242]|uniref:gamma-glutamylcyclotransferase n=1 Tax=Agromyces litoreus TaxID=3158561 RepID=UPI0033931E28
MWTSPSGLSAIAGVAAVVVAVIGILVALPRGDSAPAPAADLPSSSAEAGSYVFVYGTSMPGQSRYGAIEEYVQSATRAEVDGLLYDTGYGYPAGKFEPGGVIRGFLLELEDTTAEAFLREQTALEAGLFAQSIVQTSAGVAATAWEWIGATDGLPRIDEWDGSTGGYGVPVPLGELAVGECFADPRDRTATVVWCEAPHWYEAIVVEPLADGPYDEEAIDADASARCDEAFSELSDATPGLADHQVEAFVPDRRSWEAGDHALVCGVGVPGDVISGSLLFPA